MSTVEVTLAQARRFVSRIVGLTRPFASVGDALRVLGYVQLDPINICGRMHDLILRNRVDGYMEGDLGRHVHPTGGAAPGEMRKAFEHYLPNRGILVAFPNDAWPAIDAVLRARRGAMGQATQKLSRPHELIARKMIEEIGLRGPLMSDDFDHPGSTITAWGTPGRLVKHILEVLFRRGDLLIADRRNFRRVYDLPERVIPRVVRDRPPLEADDLVRWLAVLGLRQRRLVSLRRKDRSVIEDLICTVRVKHGPVLHCLREDLPELEASKDELPPPVTAQLLAPLDPLIYDRAVTRRLWDFEYTWEVYTPPAKRLRGYYALPVFSKGELVGHVDPRADRADGRLVVLSRSVRRGHATAMATQELARFLGLTR